MAEELRALTLRQLREEMGKTQAELAELAGMTVEELDHLEREESLLGNLRERVRSLGAELEVIVAIGKERVRLQGAEQA